MDKDHVAFCDLLGIDIYFFGTQEWADELVSFPVAKVSQERLQV